MIQKDYIRFVHQRDLYIEEYLKKTHLKIADVTRACLEDVNAYISQVYPQAIENQFTQTARDILEHLYFRIDQRFEYLVHQLANLMDRLAQRTYFLTYASEYEAISVLKGQDSNLTLPEYVSQASKYYSLYKPTIINLTSKIKQKIESSYAISRDLIELEEQLGKIYPSTQKIKRELIKVREAKKDPEQKTKILRQDFIPEEVWYDLIREYKEEYISPYRNKKDINGEFYKVDEKYAWQVEQQTTNEFLQQVKSGMVDAANERGITDFLWIAVLDDRTRPLHRMFHGLTSTEIRERYEDEYGDDPDYGETAPSGFNCRCRSVPFFGELDRDNEELITDDFENWIEK